MLREVCPAAADMKDHQGRTPLMRAEENDKSEVAAYLSVQVCVLATNVFQESSVTIQQPLHAYSCLALNFDSLHFDSWIERRTSSHVRTCSLACLA